MGKTPSPPWRRLNGAGLAVLQSRVDPGPFAAPLAVRVVVDVEARFAQLPPAVKASKASYRDTGCWVGGEFPTRNTKKRREKKKREA